MTGDRGAGVNLPAGGAKIGLPTRVFLFTIDQISVMTDIGEPTLRNHHIFYQGRSIGSRKKAMMVAINVAPPEEKPDWRITEREFIRWMRLKGFRYYERGAFA